MQVLTSDICFMIEPTVDICTFELSELANFKEDKQINAAWADNGLYITLSAIKDDFWSCNVTSTKNFLTIRPSVDGLNKYDGGLIMLIKRTDRTFTKYELDWLTHLLYNELRKTDLDFTCANPMDNPIVNNVEKQAELEPMWKQILDELNDYKYNLKKYARYDVTIDEGSTNVAADHLFYTKFGGHLSIEIDYSPKGHKSDFNIKIKDEFTDSVIIDNKFVIPGNLNQE